MPFHERYKTGVTPWEINRPDRNLIDVVKTRSVSPCSVLDIGCGTGDNTIWLQKNGFAAVGVDRVDMAIRRAREKAAEAGIVCDFRVFDFMGDALPEDHFDMVFDRGCFHHFLESDRLADFAEKVHTLLAPKGIWLTLAGSADETREGQGPPQLSALQIIKAVEPYFELVSLEASHFDSDQEIPAKNWVCLLKRR